MYNHFFLFSFVRKPLDLLKSFYISKVYPELVDFDEHEEVNEEKISFKDLADRFFIIDIIII